MLRHEYHRCLGRVVGLDATTEAALEAQRQEIDGLNVRLEALQLEADAARTRRRGDVQRQIAKLETEILAHKGATLETRYNADSESVQAFMRWALSHYQALRAVGLVSATPANLQAKPLETIGDSLRRCGLEQRSDAKRSGRSYAVRTLNILAMSNYSRPRRRNWDFAQQTDIQGLYNDMLRENGVSASPTTTITDIKKVDTPMTLMKPPLNPDDAATWLLELLDAKRLEPFGSRKLN